MSFFQPIYRKEFRRYFATPVGPVLLAGSAVLCGAMAAVAGDDRLRQRLLAPPANLTGFLRSSHLAEQPSTLVAAMARLLAMVLMPMITMRLFPEEKQAGAIEVLVTSPVNESDIVLGKWMGALSLHLLMVGVSLLIVGEAVSTLTRHQSAAAAMAMVICAFGMRLLGRGVIGMPEAVGLCLAAMAGWLLTVRSVRTIREAC